MRMPARYSAGEARRGKAGRGLAGLGLVYLEREPSLTGRLFPFEEDAWINARQQHSWGASRG